jgi:3-oxoacyl-[acyl-carrier protein] reductase
VRVRAYLLSGILTVGSSCLLDPAEAHEKWFRDTPGYLLRKPLRVTARLLHKDPPIIQAAYRCFPFYLQKLDILVNNAGGATVGSLMSLDETWKADIDFKLLGYMRMMRAAAAAMREQGGGRIVNVVGLAGHEPYHLLTVPSVVNAGLLALTKSAADELAADGVVVNAVNPNAAETGLGDRMIEELAAAQGTSSKEVREYLVGATPPLGRLARPEDFAATVLFYASGLSGFATGTSLTIDGGAHRAIA